MVPVIEFKRVVFNGGVAAVLLRDEPPQMSKMHVEPLLPDGTENHKKPLPVQHFFRRESLLKFPDSASSDGKHEVMPKQKITVFG